MKRNILLVMFCFFGMGSTLAQESGIDEAFEKTIAEAKKYEKRMLEALENALSDCSTSQPELIHQGFGKDIRDSMLIDWTGACVDGKHDGHGALIWKTNRSYVSEPNTTIATSEHRQEGRFVKGQRVGLWCGYSKGPRNSEEGCVILAGHGKRMTNIFRKQSDGTWLEYVGGNKTNTRQAAGTLEAYSEGVIDDFLASRPIRQMVQVMQSPILNDLVRGSKIVFIPSTVPVSLKDKRVAIVLSSGTLTELARFNQQREEVIAATRKIPGDAWIEKFVAASNSDRMLVAIYKVLAKYAKVVQPMDDLSVLQKGNFDYAFVLDWKNMTQLDKVASYYRSPSDLNEAIVAEQSLSAFLINRELKAVMKFNGMKNYSESKNWYSKSGDMRFLAEFFELNWSSESTYATYNSFYSQLDRFLKY